MRINKNLNGQFFILNPYFFYCAQGLILTSHKVLNNINPLIEHFLTITYFSYNDQFYKQTSKATSYLLQSCSARDFLLSVRIFRLLSSNYQIFSRISTTFKSGIHRYCSRFDMIKLIRCMNQCLRCMNQSKPYQRLKTLFEIKNELRILALLANIQLNQSQYLN